MAKFNMMDLLNNNSKEATEPTTEKINKFKTISINVDDLVPSSENFYSVDEQGIEELKDSIEAFGLQQNLVVKRIDNNKYEIIAGHRRYLALKKLYEEGKEQFQYAPCKVENDEDAIRNKLILLITNSTARELTEYEKMQQAQKLKELLLEYKQHEKLPGRVREIVADILNVATSKIARMESISKNLSDDLKQEFKEENINISTAYEASKLPEEKQDEVYQEYKDRGNITIKDVKKKSEVKKEKINEDVSNLDTNTNTETIDLDTGEIVEQKVPNYLNKKIFDLIKEFNIDEMAVFFCSRCKCEGQFCDFASDCTEENKHQLCVDWLSRLIE
ncbi:MAG: ParB/RepB/Spo0J family partition protein [Clostridium butyricum]|nr:ParB/RepB/Spo0J family partition protein [Clostridium butyricum]